MPYIGQLDRVLVEPDPPHVARNAGELNFQITCLVDEFLLNKGRNYAAINEAIGALECAKLELYRRVAAPYEDIKISANGDVYSKENLT